MLNNWTKRVSSFYLDDGRIISRLTELVKILDDLSDDVFNRHVNEQKNDFYMWIKDCINNNIAKVIKNKRDKQSMKNSLLMELLREVESLELE